MKVQNIVIIGAGPAGLTAAYELLKQLDAANHVIVLEESSVVGGISRTVVHNGHRMDIGGHRFFSKDERVTKWWNERMPMQGCPSKDDRITGREVELFESGPDPEAEDKVSLKRRRVSRIYYKKKFFDYPVKLSPSLFINMGLFGSLSAGLSYLKSAAHKREVRSLEDYYVNSFGKRLYSMFFESYTQKLWGRHPSQISPDWGAQRTKGLSVSGVLKDAVSRLFKGKGTGTETSLIEEFMYPKYGPGQLWEVTADEIRRMGGEIIFGAKVDKIAANSDKISFVSYEKGGERHNVACDMLFSSMPLKDLAAAFDDVPSEAAYVAENLPYRDFVTVGLLLPKLLLKNKTKLKTLGNIVPDCWIYVQDSGVRMGRIQIFNNWSPYLVKDPEHTVWLGLEYFCSEGDAHWNMGPMEWKGKAAYELMQMGIMDENDRVLDFHVEKVKKAYPAYFDTYSDIHVLREWLDGFTNLWCIGRNGQHRYNNMDHSMATAFEAVRLALEGSVDKSPVWAVNTDKEYHEEKS